jgi:hypothetical protein
MPFRRVPPEKSPAYSNNKCKSKYILHIYASVCMLLFIVMNSTNLNTTAYRSYEKQVTKNTIQYNETEQFDIDGRGVTH